MAKSIERDAQVDTFLANRKVQPGIHGTDGHERAINAWIADPAGWHRAAYRPRACVTASWPAVETMFPDGFRAA